MTDPTPSAPSPGHPSAAFAAAGWVCVAYAIVLVGIAVFFVVELVSGAGSGVATVIAQTGLILVTAVLLGVLARVWFLGSRRAAVPTVVWNVFVGVPALYAAYLSGALIIAAGLGALVLLGLATTWWALRSSRPAPR